MPSSTASESTLIGRSAELGQIALAIADPVAHGVALVGAAGLGKSRLAFECMALGERAGFAVVQAVATPAAKQITLGALSHLLPPRTAAADPLDGLHSDLQPAHMLSLVQSGLTSRAQGRPLMLVVDDAHHLDAASAHLIHQLAATDSAFVVFTLRVGEEFPLAISSMWKDQLVRRIDVGDLADNHIVELAEFHLSGPLGSDTARAIVKAARGNALFARELALGARESGALTRSSNGEWAVNGSLGHTPRLRDLVESRLVGLDAEQRRVLDLIALTEPIGAEFIQEIFSLDVLATLEQRGLIMVQQDHQRLDVRMTHPLYAESLAGSAWTLRRRADVKALTVLVRKAGARRASDAIRVASWELEATGRADPDVLVRACLGAHYSADDRLAERLSRAGIAQLEPGDLRLWQFQFVLGATLARTGNYRAAEPILIAALSSCGSADARVRIRLSMAAGVAECDGNTVRAVELFDSIQRDALGVSPELLVDAALLKAVLLADSGYPVDALAILEETSEEFDSPSLVVMRSLAMAASLLAVGRCVDGLRAADKGLHDHLAFGDVSMAYHPASHFLYRINGLLEDGRCADAWRDAEWLYNFGVENDRNLSKSGGAILKARIALRQGRAATAITWSEQALQHSGELKSTGHGRWALAACSAAHALRGDIERARELLKAIEEQGGVSWFIGEPELILARLWIHRAMGRHDSALEYLGHVIDQVHNRGCYQLEGLLLLEAQRIVATADRAQRLAELAALSQGRMIAAASHTATGLAKKDGVMLDRAAELWAQCESWLNAAEASSKAADMHRKAGDQRRATASTNATAPWLALTEGAMSSDALVLDAHTPLTAREREIALRAASGASSKSIAAELFLSARTVDNHLQRIYTKLGVVGRDELGSRIGVT